MKLLDLQEQFIMWNSERQNISLTVARERFMTSYTAVKDGHSGRKFRALNTLNYKIFTPFFGDTEPELLDAYSFHGAMHFLRMLSYDFKPWKFSGDILVSIPDVSTIGIIDYGCGLAQSSRWLALTLKEMGKNPFLALVDIPTLRREFLLWLTAKEGIETVFCEVTPDTPRPELPESDICIATEFFEHVHEPSQYFRHIDAKMRPGAWLITNVSDHRSEFMHVSPDLAQLRKEIQKSGYENIIPDTLFRKQGV